MEKDILRAQLEAQKKELIRLQREYDKLQNLYAELCEYIPEINVSVDEKLNIFDCNRAFAYLLGYKQEELIGKSLFLLFTKKSRVIIKRIIRDPNKKENHFRNRGYQLIRKDGKIVEVNADTDMVCVGRDRIYKSRVYFQEVSETKRLKEEVKNKQYMLDTILNTMKEGVLIINPDYKIQFMNKYLRKMFGSQIGNDCYKVLHGKKSKCSDDQCPDFQILSKNKPFHIFYRKDQRGNFFEITSFPFPNIDNSRSVLQVFRDITENWRLQEKLRECKLTYLKELRARYKFDNIIGKSEKMQEIFDLIASVAQTQCTVLIQGESGTGKELIARAIHYNSPQSEGPFIAVSCSVFSESLLESELFGHVKGSFTGAIRDKRGRFELADGGTIFLDEIGDISPSIQGKLLRVLQEREFEPVGGEKTIKVNLRVLAATNKNLEREVEEGRFREDLYYRLAMVPIFVPPLRDRMEDLSLLVNHMIKRCRKNFKKEVTNISPDAMEILLNYHWPGNIRELEGILEYAFIKSKGNFITPGDLPRRVLITKEIPKEGNDVRIRLHNCREISKELIISALRKTNGNKKKAAEILHISRTTLWKLMKIYNFPGPLD